MESLHRLQEVDPGWLTCINYLMAAADYQDFVEMMLEHQECINYEEDEAYDPVAACQQY